MPLGDISLLWKGVVTAETCGIDLRPAMADSIAALSAASVTLTVPALPVPWVAKTIEVEPPLKAGNLEVSTAAAFCDSVPGMLKVSFVLPPLAWAIAMAAMAAASQSPRTSRLRR